MGLEKDDKDPTETPETAANPDAPAPAPVPPPAPTPAEPAKPVQYVGPAISGDEFDPKDIKTLQPDQFASIMAAAGSTPPPAELEALKHQLRVPTTDMLIQPIRPRISNTPPLPPPVPPPRQSSPSLTAVKPPEAIPQKPQPVLFHIDHSPSPTIVMDIKQNVAAATDKICRLLDQAASERTRTASIRSNIKFEMVGALWTSGKLDLESFITINEKKPEHTRKTITELFEEITKDLNIFLQI